MAPQTRAAWTFPRALLRRVHGVLRDSRLPFTRSRPDSARPFCQETLDALPVGVAVLAADGAPLFLNAHLRDGTALDCTALVHADDRPRLFSIERPGGEVRARLQRRDGAYRWHRLMLGKLPQPRRDGATFVAACLDLHDAPAPPPPTGEAPPNPHRLAELGLLCAQVAHDFANILTCLQVCLGQLEARPADPDQRRLVGYGLRAVALAGAMVEQLMASVRRSAPRPGAVRLQDVLTVEGSLLPYAVGAQVEVIVQVAPDTWPVQIDPGALDVALLNLATNARHAMPAGGQLRVTAHNIPSGAPLASGLRAGDYVAIVVQDTGSGMTPAQLARAGERFFTTRAGRGGTGLGLASVRDFVTSAGGAMRIDSAPGVGTTVELLLPRAAGAEAPPTPT